MMRTTTNAIELANECLLHTAIKSPTLLQVKKGATTTTALLLLIGPAIGQYYLAVPPQKTRSSPYIHRLLAGLEELCYLLILASGGQSRHTFIR